MQKTILITGSTDGIGLATAKQLISQGHQILLHGRNATKLRAVVEQLNAQYPNANIQSYVSDLSNMQDVKALAKAVTDQHSSLDVLINNAGVFRTPNLITSDGMDVRFAVNTFAPYLLTQLLLPLMSNTSRVINLSSAAQAPVDIDALRGKARLDDMGAYAQSKLAITMWSRVEGLAHAANGPMIVAVNPGSLLGSKMVKEGFGVEGGDLQIGADILCKAALHEDFSAASGQYFDNDAKQFAPPHPDALDDSKAEAITKAVGEILARA